MATYRSPSSLSDSICDAEFLVTVENDSLVLNQKLIEDLSAGNNPTGIVSIIGQPLSGKSLLANQLREFVQSSVEKADVGASDNNSSSWELCSGKAGIVLWKRGIPIVYEDGSQFLVYFIDICPGSDESHEMSEVLYKKLIDFCIYVSSSTILAEIYPVKSLYWSPKESFLDLLQPNRKMFQQLHVLIQDWYSVKAPHLFHEEISNFLRPSATSVPEQGQMNLAFNIPNFIVQFFDSVSMSSLPTRTPSSEEQYFKRFAYFVSLVTNSLCPVIRDNVVITQKMLPEMFQRAILVANDIRKFSEFHMEETTNTEGVSRLEVENNFSKAGSPTDCPKNPQRHACEREADVSARFAGISFENTPGAGDQHQHEELTILNGVNPSSITSPDQDLSNGDTQDLAIQDNHFNGDKNSLDRETMDTTEYPPGPSSTESINAGDYEFIDSTDLQDLQPMSPGNSSGCEPMSLDHQEEIVTCDIKKGSTLDSESQSDASKYLDSIASGDKAKFQGKEKPQCLTQTKVSSSDVLMDTTKSDIHQPEGNSRSVNVSDDFGTSVDPADSSVPNGMSTSNSAQCPKPDSEVIKPPSESLTTVTDQPLSAIFPTRDSHESRELIDVIVHPIKETAKEEQTLEGGGPDVTKEKSSSRISTVSQSATENTTTNPAPGIARRYNEVTKSAPKATNPLADWVSQAYQLKFKALESKRKDSEFIIDEKLIVPEHHHIVVELLLESQKKFKSQEITRKTIEDLVQEDFKKILDHNRKQTETFGTLHEILKDKLNEIFTTVESNLSQQISSDPMNVSLWFPHGKLTEATRAVTHMLERKWKNYFENLINVQKLEYINFLNSSRVFVISYFNELWKLVTSSICVEDVDFHRIKNDVMEEVKCKLSFKKSSRQELADVFDIWLACMTSRLHNYNERIFRQEEAAAKTVADLALRKYKENMDQKLVTYLMTDESIESVHEQNCCVLLEAFKDLQAKFQLTAPWHAQVNELSLRLNQLLVEYKKKNRQNLEKMARLHGRVLFDAEQKYREMMNSFMKPIKVSEFVFQKSHDSSETGAVSVINERTSELNDALKRRWVDDCKRKCNSIKEAFWEENNEKPAALSGSPASESSEAHTEIPKNPPHPSLSSPGEKHSSTPSNLHVGVGIYIGFNEIIVSVYKDKATPVKEYFTPHISFSKEKVTISAEAKHDPLSYDIFRVLESPVLARSSHRVYGDFYAPFGTAEIVSLYFHRLRLAIERRISQPVDSCVVAISGLYTSRTRQLIKTALSVAGFLRNKLVPHTAVMALSYYRQNSLGADGKVLDVPSPILLIHQMGHSLEVATATVKDGVVSMKTISGVSNLFQWTTTPSKKRYIVKWTTGDSELERKVKHILKDALSKNSGHKYNTRSQQNQSKKVLLVVDSSPLRYAVEKKMKDFSFSKLVSYYSKNTFADTVAAYHAYTNTHPDFVNPVCFPKFTSVYPYSMFCCPQDEAPFKVVHKNQELYTSLQFSFNLEISSSATVRSIDIEERSVIHKQETLVNETNFQVLSTNGNVFVPFVLHTEGNLEVKFKSVESNEYLAPLATIFRYMITEEKTQIFEKIRAILLHEEPEYVKKIPWLPKSQDNAGKTVPEQSDTLQQQQQERNQDRCEDVIEDDPAADIKRKLSKLVEDTKARIENNTETNAMVLDKIRTALKQCEELLAKPECKIKQLELKCQSLEMFVSRIKS